MRFSRPPWLTWMLVFEVVYDFLVERRQKVVMKSAMQSGAVVSSLFPEDVSGFVSHFERRIVRGAIVCLNVSYTAILNAYIFSSLLL